MKWDDGGSKGVRTVVAPSVKAQREDQQRAVQHSRPTHRRRCPRPLAPPPGNALRRQDRISTAVSSLSTYLPALVILPIIAATSYYLVVLNGPTPVVKERGIGDSGEEGAEWNLAGRLILQVFETLWNRNQDFRDPAGLKSE